MCIFNIYISMHNVIHMYICIQIVQKVTFISILIKSENIILYLYKYI